MLLENKEHNVWSYCFFIDACTVVMSDETHFDVSLHCVSKSKMLVPKAEIRRFSYNLITPNVRSKMPLIHIQAHWLPAHLPAPLPPYRTCILRYISLIIFPFHVNINPTCWEPPRHRKSSDLPFLSTFHP